MENVIDSKKARASKIDLPLFSEKNPFFEKGEAKIFSCGTVSFVGFVHQDYELEGESYSCFGYWERGEEKDFQTCFRRYENWVKEKGLTQILGPINFSTLHDYRLPLSNFKNQSFLGEPKGRQKDVETLKNNGFLLYQDYTSHYIKDPSKIFKWGEKRSQKVLKMSSSLTAVSFHEIDFKRRKDEIYSLINRIFKNNLGFLKASEFELNQLYNEQILNWISQYPFFFIKEEERLVGMFSSFIDKNVFDEASKEVLYFKTIGSLQKEGRVHNPIFFYLIHQIFHEYKKLNKQIPICFALMKTNNVAERVAMKFSDESKRYGLFRKRLV